MSELLHHEPESDSHGDDAEAPVRDVSVEDKRTPRRRSSIFEDPIVRRLAWVGAAMLVAFLATVVSALAFGVINSPVPRTAVEQELAVAETRIGAGDADAKDWYDYISALISSKQYTKAKRMIQTAQAGGFDDPAQQYLLVAQVRLDLARGDYEEAIGNSEVAMRALEAQLKVEKELYEKTKKPSTMIADGLGDNYDSLRLNRAEAFEKLGRLDEAIAMLDDYLAENAVAADVLVWRGDMKVAAGDTAGAIVDYKAASVFMPGDEALLKKLEGLGAKNE